MNRLTNVPNSIEPIMAMDKGFCKAEPMSEENNNGTIAFLFGYGFGTAEAIGDSDDWFDAVGYAREFVHYSFNLLVHLS